MRTLISKLQYYYFEKGDFDKIEERSLADTLLLIHNFPWEEQRNGIFINLNGPSVTVENGKGAFLKIGVYYHGKFILYYLNENNQIFCRIVDRLSEMDQNVDDFFNQKVKETDYNKYRDGLYQKKKLFATGKFEYKVSFWRTINLIGLAGICGLFYSLIFLVVGFKHLEALPVIVLIYSLFFAVSWVLFFNYYFFCRNLYLKVSRGVDKFYFGKKGSINKYSKKEIQKIITYNNKIYKNPWGNFVAYEIQMQSGEVLKLTNLVIGKFKFGDKFPEQIVRDKHKFLALVKKDTLKI